MKDSDRFTKFSATFDDLMLVDFLQNRITRRDAGCQNRHDLAKETDLAGAIKSMFSGEKSNPVPKTRAVPARGAAVRSNTPITLTAKM